MATILVVDDRPINRKFLVTLLTYGNHRLLEAADGEEALALTRAERPDLVITDIVMPRLDGHEFVRRLREEAALAGTRVIFYTATFRVREARTLAQSVGVSAVLSKPSEPGVILHAVNAALGVTGPSPSPPTSAMPRAVGPEPSGQTSDKLAEQLGGLRGLSQSVVKLIERGRVILEERDQLRERSDRLSESLTDLQSVGLQLSTLIELGLEVAGEREPVNLLETSCRAAQDILGAKYAGVGLLDRDQQHLNQFITRGMGAEQLARLGRPPARTGVLGQVLAEGRPLRVQALNGSPQAVGMPSAHPPIHSFLAVPIASPKCVYGWLYVADKLGAEAFSDSDEQVALTLATQLAVAYENVSLCDEIQRHAVQLELEVTQRKRAEEALRQARDDLELRVRERTAELSETVETLNAENERRTLAEEALRERTDQLRVLTSQMTLVEQRERRRVAETLHDELQQFLVGARMRVATLLRGAEESVRQTAGEVEELINHSLELSRSLARELSPPILHEGGLVPALEWLVRWMREKHGLRVELTAVDGVSVEADSLRVFLFQAVRELLLNVVKHARIQSAAVQVSRRDGEIQIEVSDQGIGFDPAELQVKEGTAGGFGLFSIRERLDLLGGRLEVDSSPGQGSRFTLLAPLGAPVAEDSHAVIEGSASVEVVRPIPRGRRIRVLLVDDHVIVRQALTRLLTEEPDIDIVGEASEGRGAVALTRQLLPDVVIMDVSMPGMNGIEATRAIHAELPSVQVIGLSMYEESEKGKAMRAAGAVEYVSKVGPSDALIAAIRACCPGSTTS